jgi:hypothetical protein
MRVFLVTGVAISAIAAAFSAIAQTAAPVTTPHGPAEAAFHVSPTGSDSASGSAAHPFASLARARAAMAGSTVKTTVVEGGSYALSATLNLTAKDNGETFGAAPGQIAILDGRGLLQTLIHVDGARNVAVRGLTIENSAPGSSGALLIDNGARGTQVTANHFLDAGGDAVLADNSANSTVSGNQLDNSGQSAVEDKTSGVNTGGTTNDVYSFNIVNGSGSNYGAFYLHGTTNAQVINNLVKNTAGIGIGVEAIGGYIASPTVHARNIGTVVSGNILENTNADASDSGAIYVIDRTGKDTGIRIINNEINGASSRVNDPHIIGIYLDDYASGVMVSHNIIRRVQGSAIQLHGGRNDRFTNNILDTSGVSNSQPAVLLQAAPADITPANGPQPATNDIFAHNVFYSTQSAPIAYENLGLSPLPGFQDNLYYDVYAAYGGMLDSSPTLGNPGFAGADRNNYALGAGSAASALGFDAIHQMSQGPLPGRRPAVH